MEETYNTLQEAELACDLKSQRRVEKKEPDESSSILPLLGLIGPIKMEAKPEPVPDEVNEEDDKTEDRIKEKRHRANLLEDEIAIDERLAMLAQRRATLQAKPVKKEYRETKHEFYPGDADEERARHRKLQLEIARRRVTT